jgi:hypothetical protein
MDDRSSDCESSISFPQALREELEDIKTRRQRSCPASPQKGEVPKEAAVLKEALDAGLMGLALSGGGIRSATFGLGFLQGLARMRMLGLVDYLSTVSGGGYIGGWLAAWIKRDGFDEVQRQLGRPELANEPPSTGQPEPQPVVHLRRYSNYLAPRLGAFSTDGWTLWAIYLRNFLLNQCVLLPAVVIVLLLSRGSMLAYFPRKPDGALIDGAWISFGPLNWVWCLAIFVAVGLCWLVAFTLLFSVAARVAPRGARGTASGSVEGTPGNDEGRQRGLAKARAESLGQVVTWVRCFLLGRSQAPPGEPAHADGAAGGEDAGRQRTRVDDTCFARMVFPAILLLALSAAVFCAAAPYNLPWPECAGESWGRGLPALVFGGVAALALAVAFLLARAFSRVLATPLPPPLDSGRKGRRHLLAVTVAGLVGGLLLYAVHSGLHEMYVWNGADPLESVLTQGAARVTTFGPPLVLLVAVLAIALGGALRRRSQGEEMREWWANVSGQILRLALVWMAVNLVALYGTAAVIWAGPWLRTALASGWVATVAGGVLAARSGRTDGTRSRLSPLDLLARAAPPVFVAGLLVGVSLLVSKVIDNPPDWDSADNDAWPQQVTPERPPTRVSHGVSIDPSSGLTTKEAMQELDEYEVVPDRSLALRQGYWMGILNPVPHAIPTAHYLIDPNTTRLLEENGFSRRVWAKPLKDLPTEVKRIRLDKKQKQQAKLATENVYVRAMRVPLEEPPPDSIDLGPDEYTRTELREALANLLPGRDHLELRKSIIDAARRVKMDPPPPHPTQVKPQPDPEWSKADLNAYVAIVLQDQPLAAAACTSYFLKVPPPPARTDQDGAQHQLIRKLASWIVGSFFLLLTALFIVDVNVYSLHAVYGNRLVRGYLGASRPKRAPNPNTGLDPDDDDIKLADLRPGAGYHGPILIVNTALNLVNGEELAWQERKAASFPLTPISCGWRAPAPDGDSFRRTERGYADGLSLGTAMTISGAAASPNSGFYSSTAVTILLTVFNARLGAWLGNPRDEKRWKTSGPPGGLFYLFRELFGLTNDRGGYVYLSDGGHFEDLGGYELIRRRCSYVVLCDGGADPDHTFADLGNLIRKCRTDFGIRIEIDLEALRLSSQPACSRWHCAVGRIRYDDVDRTMLPGTLVYVKASLTGDEPADLVNYAKAHPDFPHHTTADQFFNESQFESYRELGLHIAAVVFGEAVAEAEESDPDRIRADFTREVFTSIERRWFSMPAEYEPSFLASTRGYTEVQEALRDNPLLHRLTRDLYPELFLNGGQPNGGAGHQATATVEAAEVHAVAQMLQVMENAWLGLKLDVHYAHPLNRGWMDVFHRWTNAPTVRRLWPLLRSEFSREFIRFAERQMRLGVVQVSLDDDLDQTPDESEQMNRLVVELEDQWPGVVFTEKKLGPRDFLTAVARSQLPVVLAKLIYTRNPYPPEDQATHRRMQVPPGVLTVTGGTEETSLELFVWIRGAYRNSGLGRGAVEAALRFLDETLSSATTLRVRLPLKHLTGPGGELQQRMWLGFYHNLGFEYIGKDERGNELLTKIVGRRG